MKIKANSRGGVPVWSLSDRLSKSLEYGEVSKLEMADYLGVSANTVGNYLAGRTKISRGFLVLWAQRTGVDPVWLETGAPPSGEITGPGVQ
jgi:transcriptional regulator with XRE-family HTH domain